MNYKYFDNMFSEREFPEHLCTIQSQIDPKIYDSNVYYFCLVIDKRFPKERSIKLLKPYIWTDGNEKGYAWIDESDNWIDNYKNPVHGFGYSDEFVIRWNGYYQENNSDTNYLNNLVEQFK